MIKFSVKARQGLLGTTASPPSDKSVRTLFNTMKMIICGGSEPLYPEMPVTAANVLATSTAGFAWSIATISGYDVYLGKSGTWSLLCGAYSGTATFYRLYESNASADDGYSDDTSAPSKIRIQGTIGETSAFDLVVADAYYVAGQTKTIDTFRIRIF